MSVVTIHLAEPERTSPFLPLRDGAPLEPPGEAAPSLFLELLTRPDRIIERVLDPGRQTQLALWSLATVALGGLFFGAIAMSGFAPGIPVRSALLSTGNVLVALAAALGPIHAVSVLLAARVPLPQLVAVLVAATASGCLVLAALAPIPHAGWAADVGSWGPISTLACYAVAALVTGARLHALLRRLAAAVRPVPACADDHERIGALARGALLVVLFTNALAFWGFDAFAPR